MGDDFQLDRTTEGRRLKLCNVVERHAGAALAMRVWRTCTADDVAAVLEDLIVQRGGLSVYRWTTADN